MTLIVSQKSEFVKQLVRALEISEYWRHIVIDISINEVVTIYVEMFADEDKLKLIPFDVTGMKIVIAKELK